MKTNSSLVFIFIVSFLFSQEAKEVEKMQKMFAKKADEWGSN